MLKVKGVNLKKILFTIIAIVLLTVGQTHAATVAEIKQAIINQSKAMGVDPAIMLSIAKTESGFNQNAMGAGTVGVFQLMPSTAKRMGYNPYNLDENIKAGITYYKNAYNMLGSMELAVAAYNAGPDAVKRCHCVPARCQGFVAKIMRDYKYFKAN